MDLADFDFDLPEDLIALRPVSPRDSARLLIVRAGGTAFEEAQVRDLPRFLAAGDVMVANDTRVIPAQLFGRRMSQSRAAEAAIAVTLHTRLDSTRWLAFAKPARKAEEGDRLAFDGGLEARIVQKRGAGDLELAFSLSGAALDTALAEAGLMPLPPYIAKRRPADAQDRTDYQTVFAQRDGAVAAPTAGLHFTPELLAGLDAAGVQRSHVTLHVGPGTFLPVRSETLSGHRLHAERGIVTSVCAGILNARRRAGARMMAVGTTTLRLLESAADEAGIIHPFDGETDIFIRPGHRFRSADWLLTNFHLPRSTLMMLVSAFCGLETMRAAYAYAVLRRFRFYSYGDACLLMRIP